MTIDPHSPSTTATTATTAASHASPGHDPRHHSHAKLYVIIWVVLLILTGVTVWTGNTDAINEALGRWALILALVIASVKGLLVALYFMHLSEASATNKLVIGVSIGFVALLIGLSVADSNTRWRYTNSAGSSVSDLPQHDLPRDFHAPQRELQPIRTGVVPSSH